MRLYDDLIKIIAEAGDNVDFAPFGEGVSEEWIDVAEKRPVHADGEAGRGEQRAERPVLLSQAGA